MEKPSSESNQDYWHQLRGRLSKLSGPRPRSHEELMGVMQEAQQQGLLDLDELDTIHRLLQVSEFRASRRVHLIKVTQTGQIRKA